MSDPDPSPATLLSMEDVPREPLRQPSWYAKQENMAKKIRVYLQLVSTIAILLCMLYGISNDKSDAQTKVVNAAGAISRLVASVAAIEEWQNVINATMRP
jgi:ribosomal protein S19E (S16A)